MLIFDRLRRVRNLLRSLSSARARIEHIEERIDEIAVNQGKLLSIINSIRATSSLQDYEFKVFSQWGEDGIIQHIITSIEIENKTFIEFGVEDFFESNCRFLLMNNNWKGFVIDGNREKVNRLKQAYFFWKHYLVAIDAFITRDNINELLQQSGFAEDLGILSIDLDGNDYWILEAIKCFKPRILICEYNSVFGRDRKISIPYKADFDRTIAHHSNLYWGASLAAITFLAQKKGYSLVGTNSISTNAFYVRNDLVKGNLRIYSAEDIYKQSNVRDSRDEQGRLTYITGDDRLSVIRGLPVWDVEKNSLDFL